MLMKSSFLFILFLFASLPYLYIKIASKFDRLETNHKFSIYTDQHGIPKVVAKDKISLFFGLGYSQASNRLWSLYVKKFMTSGRMAELFGQDVL